jgi:heat shock protein HtpX
MVLVGLAVLAVYASAAAVSYAAVTWLWVRPNDPWLTVAVVAAITIVMGYLSYRFGTAQLLAGLDAVELSRSQSPNLFALIDRLAGQMAVETPRVFVAALPAPNAMALGGVRGGALVIDASLFRLLSATELETILAHELAHLENYDALVQTLAYSALRTVAGVLMLFALPVVLLFAGLARALAWISGRPATRFRHPFVWAYLAAAQAVSLLLLALTVLVRAHSRRREFAADDRAVELTGKPLALARSLRKIERASEPRWSLLSPLYVHDDDESLLSRLLSTHPSIERRIDRLRDIAETQAGWRRIQIE